MKNVFLFYIDGLPLTILLLLAVLILRYVFRKQSKRTFNAIWVLLLVRLLVPVSFPAGFSGIPTVSELVRVNASDKNVTNTVTDATGKTINTVTDATGKTTNTVTDASGKVTDNVIDPAGNENYTPVSSDSTSKLSGDSMPGAEEDGSLKPQKSEPGEQTADIIMILLISGWLAGIAMLGTYYIGRQLQFRKKCSEAVPAEGEKNVYLWKYAKDACVTGLLRPRIYMPENLKGNKYEMVLRHERMHIRRHDNILLFLYFIALMLNWYNPLVWIAFAHVQHDIELACDESILLDSSVEQRMEYARTLLYIGVSRRTELFRAVSFGKGKLKERIVHIGEEHKARRIRTSLLVFLLAVAMVLCACSKKNKGGNENGENINSTENSSEEPTGSDHKDSEDVSSTTTEDSEKTTGEISSEAGESENVSRDGYTVEDTHIENEYFSLDLHKELVGLISYKLKELDDGSFEVTFYHINSRVRTLRGQLMTVKWMDFRNLYDPESEFQEMLSSSHLSYVDRRNTLIFGNLDGLRFDQFYTLWTEFNSPGGEFGVIYPDEENLGGYCIFQTGSPEMDLKDGYMLEYLDCEAYLRYDLCNRLSVKKMPADTMTDEYKEILHSRYERAVKEIADGTVTPDDEKSPDKDEPGLEAGYINTFKSMKVRRDGINEDWLINTLERNAEYVKEFESRNSDTEH